MPINRRMDKEAVVHIYNGILKKKKKKKKYNSELLFGNVKAHFREKIELFS